MRALRRSTRPHIPLAVAVAVALIACGGPATTSRPAVTAPPQGSAPVTPALRWADVEMPAAGAGSRLEAIASSEAGFVAVGAVSRGAASDAVIWHSPDGLRWEAVHNPALLAGGSLVGVAASDAAFVAVGSRSPRDAPISGAVILFSADGRGWQPVDAPLANADVHWVAYGPGGFLAGGLEADSDPIGLLWRSPDGRRWTREATQPLFGAQAAPEALSDGETWTAFGSRGGFDGVAIIWTSPDGLVWAGVELEPGRAASRRGRALIDLAIAPRARIATGHFADACPGNASCAAELRAWWSQDGGDWRLLPAGAWPFAGDLAIGRLGDAIVVARDGLHASTDGWRWTPLAAPELDLSPRDLAVRDETVVVAGERFVGADGVASLASATP